MRAEKIAIAISKNKYGKYTVQLLGINGSTVVSSVPELEESGIGLATASRVVERLWVTVKLRLNRGLLEFATGEQGKDDDNQQQQQRSIDDRDD